jgi:hypothetical protein
MDAPQQALGFLISQTSYIESEVVKTKYPDVQYPLLTPVDTSATEWAKSVTYFSSDQAGQAQWFHHEASDIALADISHEKHETGVEMAGIGYRYTLEELGQAMMIPGTNLSADRASAARRAYEEFVDNIAMRGNTDKGWTGLINSAAVTPIPAIADGTGTAPAWAVKTFDKIMRDVNDALTGIYTATLTVEMADTVLLPIPQLTSLSQMQIPNTTMTVLEWIKKYNIYTMTTGGEIVFRGVRGLEKAGVNGDGRMVVYRRDPQVLKLHIPMPHRFLPVWQRGPITFDVPGIFRLGGLEVRRPAAVRYVDGISVAPA